MEIIRKKFCFEGRVQGVGFRYTAAHIARKLNLKGWVANEWDGSVRMEVQGREAAIDMLLYELSHDRYIYIDRIESEIIPCRDEKGFSILH